MENYLKSLTKDAALFSRSTNSKSSVHSRPDSCYPSHQPVWGENPFSRALKWRRAFSTISPWLFGFRRCGFSPPIYKAISVTAGRLSLAAPLLLFSTLSMLQSHFQPFLRANIRDPVV